MPETRGSRETRAVVVGVLNVSRKGLVLGAFGVVVSFAHGSWTPVTEPEDERSPG